MQDNDDMISHWMDRSLPEDGVHPEGTVIAGAGKVVAASSGQQDQLADFLTTMTPKGDEVRQVEDKGQPVEKSNSTDFQGFAMLEGEDKALLLMHPREGKDGKPFVPQLVLRFRNSEWDGWMKNTIVTGLSNGHVVSSSDNAELVGFSAVVEAPDGQRQRMGFMFTQISAIVPFRDLDKNALTMEKVKDEAKARQRKVAKKEKNRARQSAQSKKRNR